MSSDPQRWRRRALTFPLYLLAALLSAVLLPVVLPLTFLADLTKQHRLAWSRSVLFVTFYLLCEAWAIVVAGSLWLVKPLLGEARFLLINHRLQWVWSQALTHALIRLFSIRLEVTGAEALSGGPLLLFVRHASMVDTVLPMHLIAVPNRFRARYVLKAELLWDPSLDLVGNRIPNTFVRRGQGVGEIAAVGNLGVDLPADGLVVLFPEGTRYSARRQQRRLADLEERADPLLSRARSLRHTLPPRSGGALALMAAAPQADVAFCTHTGLENIQGFRQIPALVGRRIQVAFWRIPAAEVPGTDRRAWLFDQWAEVDAWISDRQDDGQVYRMSLREQTVG